MKHHNNHNNEEKRTESAGQCEEFDLCGYLMECVYAYMEKEEKQHWCLADAKDVAHDIKLHDGVEADPQEIYETIAEFIEQDAEENEDVEEE